jgi:hypothetical protein
MYIAGFFEPVLKKLRECVKGYLDDRSVIWIPQRANGSINLALFKGSLFDVVGQGATEVLICLFLFRTREHILNDLDGIIRAAILRSPDLVIRIERFKSAYDADSLLSTIQAFRPSVEVAPPSDLCELSNWIRNKYGQRIILHPRAVGAAKKSQYGDVALIYSALDLLGREYWEMKTTTPENLTPCREQFNAKLRKLGLELSPSITPTSAGEEGDEYFVKYPIGSEDKRMLEYHLKKGSDRDKRLCLRIYFFWDQETRKVVVGWLPSHLGTRAT